MHLRVFVGAPTAADVDAQFVWQTSPGPYPPATLDAATRRISVLYRNAIFDDDDEDLTANWSPTPAADSSGPSFLRSGSLPQPTFETQETGTSLGYSDASSIARFPNFQFSLHTVTPLSALYAQSGKGSRKVNVLLAAIEVQGPDVVRVRQGRDAGKEVSVLKLLLGDDHGSVCKLTAWRDTADAWAGLGPSPAIKRGDILYLQNLVAAWETGTTITFTASPYNNPTAEICYRTMPYTREDNSLRPDLRLGQSDAVVNKVAALVRWFENMAGLPSV